MIRVAIVVEGDTEREFIEQILVSHLHQKGVDMKVIDLGGGVSVSRIANDMKTLCNSFQVVTSLVVSVRSRGVYRGFERLRICLQFL